jgi:hypothetical protein
MPRATASCIVALGSRAGGRRMREESSRAAGCDRSTTHSRARTTSSSPTGAVPFNC